MSLPMAAAGPLKVATKPTFALSSAATGVAASASRAARPATRVLISSLPLRLIVVSEVLVPAPELLAGEVGALAQRLELFPHHGDVHLRAVERLRREPAVRRGDHVLAADELGEAHDALGDQL